MLWQIIEVIGGITLPVCKKSLSQLTDLDIQHDLNHKKFKR